MKKAITTLIRPRGWVSIFGRSIFLVLFAWCCIGLSSANAQVSDVKMPSDSSILVFKLADCSATDSVRFTDDNTVDGVLYDDKDSRGATNTAGPRRDTVQFCPQDEWHAVSVVFVDFDIAAGDSLCAYQGDAAALKADATPTFLFANNNGFGDFELDAAGNKTPGNFTPANGGVGAAYGGWITASCDPSTGSGNSSGCLTFIFKTTPDDIKGKGWDAWVKCYDRDIQISASMNNTKLSCTDTATLVPFPVPTFSANCGGHGTSTGLLDSSYIFTLRNGNGELCVWECVDDPAMGALPSPTSKLLAPGAYLAEYRLKSDSTKSSGRILFSIDLPNLVCNDEVNTSLNSACALDLTLDDLLENPCDSIPSGVTYTVSVVNLSGKDITVPGPWSISGPATGSGLTSTNQNIVWLGKQELRAAGLSECEGSLSLRVTRTYTPNTGTDSDVCCDNGVVSSSCEVVVNYKDETRPIIQLTADVDTLIGCDTTGLLSILNPTAIDNCSSDLSVRLQSARIAADDPCLENDSDNKRDTTTISVTLAATDACGNTGTLTRTFTLIRPDLTKVKLLDASTITASCEQSDTLLAGLGLQIGRLKNGVFTPTDTLPLSEEDYVCGYLASRKVTETPDNDCGRKDFVEWSVLDWCNPSTGPSVVGNQFVNYTDTEAPKFTATNDGSYSTHANRDSLVKDVFVVYLDGNSCTFDATTLPLPEAQDNCDDDPTVTLLRAVAVTENLQVRKTTGMRDSIAGTWAASASSLECDTFRLMYVVGDKCHEQDGQDTIHRFIAVIDNTRPTAICRDELNVSIGTGGRAFIDAASIDAGSTDACGIETRLIKVKGDALDHVATLEIECDKQGVEIELLVVDNKGNQNICWTRLNIEDKVPPVVVAPEDATGDCIDWHTNIFDDFRDGVTPVTGLLKERLDEAFGEPEYVDNCGPYKTLTETINIASSNCGTFSVYRIFNATDWADLPAVPDTQIIRIESAQDWKLTFPEDVTIDCGDEVPGELGPEDIFTTIGFCDRLSLNVETVRFDGASDACVKFVRTYTVWNDCADNTSDDYYDVNANASTSLMVTNDSTDLKKIVYVQTIRAEITQGPEIRIQEPEDLRILGDVKADGTASCRENKEFETWAGDCLDNDIPEEGLIVYIIEEATGDTLPEVSRSYEFGNLFITANVGPGDYRVEVWATDGCGNSSGHTEIITFVDGKAPTIFVTGINTHVMPATGEIGVWLSDLIGSATDCDPDFQLGIWHGSLGEAPETCEEVAALGQSLFFDCDYIGTQEIRVYGWDAYCNYDFVTTYVSIQDSQGVCDPENASPVSQVAGQIVNMDDELVSSVNVAVNGAMTESMTTDASGEYTFLLENGGDYTITPERNTDHLNGVSTFDLVLISKHILNVDQFDSPFQYIAADINNNGTITAFDIVLLRQLILNITTEFANNTSWRFVDASYEFGADVTTTLAQNFPEVMNINNLSGAMTADFTAVKIGDINGSARVSELVSAAPRNAVGTLVLNAEDRYVEAGESVSVTFTSADIASVTGYQFTMNFAGLNFAELVEGVATEANFNTNLRGALATSWNGEAAANEALFTINFTATTSGALSELISVSSDVTAAEAYNANGELLDVAIEFTGTAAQANGFNLEQNTPNPFNGETLIGFTLPKAGEATLTVMDVQGRVLRTYINDYAKGYNQISINANDLGATGILQYQLESADHVAVRKMIIIE